MAAGVVSSFFWRRLSVNSRNVPVTPASGLGPLVDFIVWI